MIKDRLAANPLPIQLPIGAEDNFRGVVDLFTMKAVFYLDDLGTKSEESEIPEELRKLAEQMHEELVEKISETDDELTFKFLEGEEITVEELQAALRKATSPIARLTMSSRSRRIPRMSVRLATLAHAMTKTNAAAPMSNQNVSVARSFSTSRSGLTLMSYPAAASYTSGWSLWTLTAMRSISARACGSVAPGPSRANTYVMRCVRPVTMVASRW
jgi:hypothetical protein